jgi:hypothetical protein
MFITAHTYIAQEDYVGAKRGDRDDFRKLFVAFGRNVKRVAILGC